MDNFKIIWEISGDFKEVINPRDTGKDGEQEENAVQRKLTFSFDHDGVKGTGFALLP